jgi:hypothetical protein
MKKAILILIVILCSTSNLLAQKKKIKKNGTTTSTALAKAENVTVELINNHLYLIMANGGIQKDSIMLKIFSENKPNAIKIAPFSAKGKKLFLISWSENIITTTKLKTEDALIVFSEIVNFETKSKVLSNTQSTINIKEIHYLDANQTVSETLQKVRKEGFELILNLDGDVVLKNKTQENKLTYKTEKNAFVSKK